MYCVSSTDVVCLLCSRWIATPLAVSAGITQRVHLKAEDNPILELYYSTQCRNPAQVNRVPLKHQSCDQCDVFIKILFTQHYYSLHEDTKLHCSGYGGRQAFSWSDCWTQFYHTDVRGTK